MKVLSFDMVFKTIVLLKHFRLPFTLHEGLESKEASVCCIFKFLRKCQIVQQM